MAQLPGFTPSKLPRGLAMACPGSSIQRRSTAGSGIKNVTLLYGVTL